MIHNIEISIKIDIINIPDKEYEKIIKMFIKNMKGYNKLSFKKLDKIFNITSRKYISASIHIPEIEKNADIMIPKTTKIEIIG